MSEQQNTLFQRFGNVLRSFLFKPKTKEYTMTDITAATQNPAVDAASANPDVTAAQAAAPEVATLTPTEPDTVAAQAAAATEGASLAAEVKKGVEDFDRALSFVEQGVTLLGAAAKTELKMLAQKYL